MARFTFDTGFMAKAQTWSPTNNINPLPAWEFMNQSGTLGTFLAGSVVYVGGTGRVKVIPTGITRPGQVLTATVKTGGAGYTAGTNIATTGGSGSGLTVNTTVPVNAVTAVTVNVKGTGYKVGDVIIVNGGTTDCEIVVASIDNLPTAADDGIEFIGAQAGTVLPIQVDYVVVPSTGAATDLIVGR